MVLALVHLRLLVLGLLLDVETVHLGGEIVEEGGVYFIGGDDLDLVLHTESTKGRGETFHLDEEECSGW